LVESRQNVVQILAENSFVLGEINGTHLKNMPDLERLNKRFISGRADLKDVLKFHQAYCKLAPLLASLESLESPLIKEQYVDPLSEIIQNLQKFAELVETTVDLEAAESHEYRIKFEFDDELLELHRAMQTVQSQIPAIVKRVSDDLGLELDKKLKLDKNTQHGYHLRVSRLVFLQFS
jgi:DNA mismatch repair protein MSH2